MHWTWNGAALYRRLTSAVNRTGEVQVGFVSIESLRPVRQFPTTPLLLRSQIVTATRVEKGQKPVTHSLTPWGAESGIVVEKKLATRRQG